MGVEVLHDRNSYRVYCHEGSQKRRHILLEETEKLLLNDRVQTRTKINLEINLSFNYMSCFLHDAVSMEISQQTCTSSAVAPFAEQRIPDQSC